jgi:molybdenum cofactor cytidylyltransferase
LAPYRGGELIDGALTAALEAPVESVVVVTGYDGERVAESVAALAAKTAAGSRLQIVHAKAYGEGMSATLRAGLAALDPQIDGVFVFLGDMPSIPHDVAARLAADLGDHAAAAPRCEGIRGHPVLFSRRLFTTLAALSGDRGAKAVLDDLGSALVLTDVADRGVLFDVDRWSDLLH